MLNIGVRVPKPRLRAGSVTRSGAVRADPAMFAAVYERHQQELYRYCRSIVQHDEDAHDVLQNTMVKAYAALQTEDRDFELRPWLFRIAHNEAISMIRRRPTTDELDERTGGCPETLHRSAESRERLSHLYADLQDLPERQRGALMMRELNGLPTAEIADALQIPVGAVKQSIYEARVGLHECAAGRDMVCEEVQRTLSEGDGRLVKSRRMRAHLRSCRSCQQFRHALIARPAALQALFPIVPVAAGTGLLAAIKGSTAAASATAGGTGAAAGTTVAGFGGGLVGLGAAKIGLVAATAVATVGGGAVITHDRHAPTRSAQTTERGYASSTTTPQRAGGGAGGSFAVAASASAGRAGGARTRSTAVPSAGDASTSSPTRGDAAGPATTPGPAAGRTAQSDASRGAPFAGGPADAAAGGPAASGTARGPITGAPATGTSTAQRATASGPGTTATTSGARPTVAAGGSSASRAPVRPAPPAGASPTAGALPGTGTAVRPGAPTGSPQAASGPGERTAPATAAPAPVASGEDVAGSVVRPGAAVDVVPPAP